MNSKFTKSNETAVLDPTVFITNRIALSLDELGIHIREASWGDADQEVFYVRQELGEIPGDRHPPNRTIVLKLKVGEETGINLAEAAQKLQQKVGLIQREGGWVMRSFSRTSGAKYNLGFEVYNAVLTGLYGWLMGHRDTAHEVTLTLTASPYCYGPEEIQGNTFYSVNNELINSSFEAATTEGWVINEGGGGTGLLLSRQSTAETVADGNFSGRVNGVNNDAVARTKYLWNEKAVPVTEGEQWYVRAVVSGAPETGKKILLGYRDSNATISQTGMVSINNGNQKTTSGNGVLLEAILTIPAGITSIQLAVFSEAIGAGKEKPFWVDAAMITPGSTAQTYNRGFSGSAEWTVEHAPGTAEGKLRLRVKNVDGTAEWLGMIESCEQVASRTNTNKMMYEAEVLTRVGGSTGSERAGASNTVVKCLVSYTWLTVLESKTGFGAMTHVGGRRISLRLWNTSTVAENVRLRLEWRSNSGEWETNDEVVLPVAPGWQLVDLGEVISQQATVGTHKMEFRIQTKEVQGLGAFVEIDKVYVLSQSQYIKLRKGLTFGAPASLKVNGTPTPVGTVGEALNGKTMTTGGTWTTSGSTKGDFLLTGVNTLFEPIIKRTAVSDTERRVAVVNTPTLASSILSMSFGIYPFISSNEGEGLQKTFGLIMHGENNIEAVVKYYVEKGKSRWELTLRGAHVETEKTLSSVNFEGGYLAIGTLSLGIVGNRVFVWVGGTSGTPVLVSTLNTTTAGKVGMFSYNPKAAAFTFAVYSFSAAENESDTLVHPGRLFDIGTGGTFRQHLTEDNWGIVPPEEGFYPSLLPAGLEQRIMQGILIASQGDLQIYDDSGNVKPSITPYYRPAYHFMSEAM